MSSGRSCPDPLRGDQDYPYPVGERLKAAKVVLVEFTKAKPAAKNEVTISRAEDCLEALAKGA